MHEVHDLRVYDRVFLEMGASDLRAPFPWFGGKSKVADIVWKAFGDVPNYVEPFFGSGAVLLGRPHTPRLETVNDKDGFIVNFWRAVKIAPEEVAIYADNPVFENDLHARHIWLVNQRDSLVPRLEGDPDYYDPKIAGWWVWGICSWIGGGWCSGGGPWSVVDGELTRNEQHDAGVIRKLIRLGTSGIGVNSPCINVMSLLYNLSDRLRNTRIASGDWSRVCGYSTTAYNGLTGVFLDPPYSNDVGRSEVYVNDDFNVANGVRDWCIENGNNKLMRIALCGYEGEKHSILEDHGWTVYQWKSKGGYGNLGDSRGRENASKERIWFSQNCLDISPSQMSMF